MPSLRQEITKTFRRLSRRGDSSPQDPAGSDTIVRPDPREGQQIGTYRILKRLGAGGMGHVYLALETRLGRHVALKFLSPDLVADPAMLHHLEQEARTASSLNHPNILTIYEIGTSGPDHFIASEYVDGVTLRVALERHAVDHGTAIDIATQIASALTAAHAAGVVHRDLKPGNVIIRPDGLVKVIDFGLAKRTVKFEQDGTDVSWTGVGPVVGTVDYMSPEQARGDEVDHRSDLWSLGVLLYEMLAHRRPFEGETESHVVVAILDQPAPALPKSENAGLARIVQRALAKDSAKRYQAATDMLADLHSISHVSRPGSGIRPPIHPRHGSRGKLYFAAAAAGLLLAFALWRATLDPDWFHYTSVRQLTYTGRTGPACISPDGNLLAFVVSEPDGTESLRLEDVKRGLEEVRLPPKKISYKGVTFSPDGQTIYVSVKDEKLMGRLYAVPVVGEAPSTPVITDVDGPVSFSPSGDRFAFVRILPGTGSQLLSGKLDHSEKVILSQKAALPLWVAWSPKGNPIAAFLASYNNATHPGSGKILELINLDGQLSSRLLPTWRVTEQPLWTPQGRTLIVPVATYSQSSDQAQLKEIEVSTGKVRDVTNDLAGYASPSLSRDGNLLAAIKLESRARLWISAPGDASSGQIASAEAGDYRSLAWSDSDHLIISSQRGGVINLWSFDAQKQTHANLTSEPYVEQDATTVPGSNRVIFASTNGGGSHIWKFDPESNTYTQLTFGDSYDQSPTVSPDGNWIVYISWSGSSYQLRRISITGDLSAQIGSYSATGHPEISPDGRWIACQLRNPQTLELVVAVIPFNGEGPVREFPNARIPLRWYPDGTALATALSDQRGVSNIWAVPLDGSAPHQITHFDDETIFAFAWSQGGERLACIRGTLSKDAVVFEKQKSR